MSLFIHKIKNTYLMLMLVCACLVRVKSIFVTYYLVKINFEQKSFQNERNFMPNLKVSVN